MEQKTLSLSLDCLRSNAYNMRVLPIRCVQHSSPSLVAHALFLNQQLSHITEWRACSSICIMQHCALCWDGMMLPLLPYVRSCPHHCSTSRNVDCPSVVQSHPPDDIPSAASDSTSNTCLQSSCLEQHSKCTAPGHAASKFLGLVHRVLWTCWPSRHTFYWVPEHKLAENENEYCRPLVPGRAPEQRGPSALSRQPCPETWVVSLVSGCLPKSGLSASLLHLENKSRKAFTITPWIWFRPSATICSLGKICFVNLVFVLLHSQLDISLLMF